MKTFHSVVLALLMFAAPALASVTVSSPTNGETVSSPVPYVATATTTTCSKGVASMGIYVSNKLVYVVDASSMNSTLSLSPGNYSTVVEEWDHCGGASYTTVGITVGSTVPPTTGVSVTSPANNSTVSSPVQYVATATTATCSKGVASMGIYVSNKLVYVVSGSSLNTQLSLAAGAEKTVVEAWDHCGGASYAPINITVGALTAPTVGITANPTSITSGNSSTLSVTATNATQVTVTGTDGSTYTLQPNGGTQAVSPTVTTTYTATATGTGGKTTATTTVTVAASPTVSITANPTSISSGSSSTLTVTATNATQVTITGTNGSTYTLQPTGGTQAVSPTVTTTYTATATGTGGKTTSASTTVTVAASPTVSITANPTSITSGNSSTLTVTATNATQVTVTGTDGSTYTLQPTGGTQAVNPTVTTTYTATATGTGGKTTTATTTVTVTAPAAPTVSISANPTSIFSGSSSTLTVTATNATQVTVSGTDGSTYTLQSNGGTQAVSPTVTTTYTATATGMGGKTTSATTTVTVTPAGSVQSINHVVFMLQENHTFDDYFGMLNPYRVANGWNIGDDGNTYTVDGIDDKLSTISNEDDAGTAFPLFKFATTCIDDDSSAWLASYGDINRYDFLTTRPINMDGFVHTAEGFANSCASSGTCSGNFTDLTGERAMGYYDQGFLNYYYYMASQFALSNRWFSPVSSKSIPNRIATFTGGTTQGLVNDPGDDDHLSQLAIPSIFQELDKAKVSWKIYYTVTDGYCLSEDDCSTSGTSEYPATSFSYLTYSYQYIYENPTHAACTGVTQASSVVGDASNSFCIDTAHIAPLSQYYSDLSNSTLPSFAFIEAGYGNNDEHPGSGQSILSGQAEVAKILNSFMASPEWNDSVFFLSYDEGGGPYDHVPPVPGHSNDYTDASLGTIPDISTIAVNADSYNPCVPSGGTPTIHCDLSASDPGANAGDAPAVQGFAAQLGFRLPNMVISPFTRRHYVSNAPMDHTAVIGFVESRFIGGSTHLTPRVAAQPNLLDFFDFNNVPWATPPTPPVPVTPTSLGYNPCAPTVMGP
jgi:phospholipase C